MTFIIDYHNFWMKNSIELNKKKFFTRPVCYGIKWRKQMGWQFLCLVWVVLHCKLEHGNQDRHWKCCMSTFVHKVKFHKLQNNKMMTYHKCSLTLKGHGKRLFSSPLGICEWGSCDSMMHTSNHISTGWSTRVIYDGQTTCKKVCFT